MPVVKLTADNFNKTIAENPKVLVDFWAGWCGPCRMLAPVVEAIGNENDDIIVGKLNVDEEGEIAGAYGITSIPTLILFRNGKPETKSVGLKSKEAILQML